MDVYSVLHPPPLPTLLLPTLLSLLSSSYSPLPTNPLLHCIVSPLTLQDPDGTANALAEYLIRNRWSTPHAT